MSIKNQIRIDNLTTFVKESNRVVTDFSSKQIVSNRDIFSLGAQLMFFGQQLTEISEYKLSPGNTEAAQILAEIANHIHSLNTANRPLITEG